jgi:hypothetical protein
MALGSTQPLTEMNTRCIPGGKGGRCVRLTTLPPSCAVVMKSRNLKFLEPSGPLQAYNGTALLFISVCTKFAILHFSLLSHMCSSVRFFQIRMPIFLYGQEASVTDLALSYFLLYDINISAVFSHTGLYCCGDKTDGVI